MIDDKLNVLKKIENHGYQAYFVGGYPRDKYMGLVSDDYDICTNAKPDDLEHIFGSHFCDMRFSSYGNVRVKYENQEYEITTFSRDFNYKNYRQPQVIYVNDLFTDLQRRDFTINTLCIDSNGNYVDLLDARKDIDNKIIKVVGNYDTKIKEDALRIIRALRFASDFNFKLDSDLIKSINKYKENVYLLNSDKVKQEIAKTKNQKRLKEYLKEFNLLDL